MRSLRRETHTLLLLHACIGRGEEAVRARLRDSIAAANGLRRR